MKLSWITTLLIFSTLSCRATRPESASLLMSDTLTVQAGKMHQLSDDERKRVLEGLRQVKDAFYVSGSGYIQTPAGKTVPPLDEVYRCFDAAPNRWSDLMTHYYCHFPSYDSGFYPNIRECFTYIVTPNTKNLINGQKPDYPMTYEYCVYAPIDREGMELTGKLKNWGAYNQNYPELKTEWKNQTPPGGPMSWVHTNQEDVFKFIMFAGPCTIDPADQQAVLNEFYNVDLKGKSTYTTADTEQVDECKAKRPRWNSNDPSNGTHCSHDLRKTRPLGEKCYP